MKLREVALGLTALLVATGVARGYPSFSIDPTRVEFDADRREAVLVIRNASKEAGSFRLTLEDHAMNTGGGLEPLPLDAVRPAWSAAPYLRLDRVEGTLKARRSAKVRLSLDVPPGLVEGELRTHVVVTPHRVEATKGKRAASEPSVTSVASVAIPVVVRLGALHATASLSDLRLQAAALPGDRQVLHVEIHRKGNASLYGDLRCVHVAPDGTETELGLVMAIAVYASIDQRHYALGLYRPVPKCEGRLVVDYTAHHEGRHLARAELPLAPETPGCLSP